MEWISVKDKLPKPKQSVYVLDLPKKLLSVGIYKPKEDEDDEILREMFAWTTMHDEVYMNYDVTHWMPFPELPDES